MSISRIPSPIQSSLQKAFGKVESFSPVSGGCINNGGKLVLGKRSFFLKWNDRYKLPGMFKAEAEGLKLLEGVRALRVPEILCVEESDAWQFMVMEWIEHGAPSAQYWKLLGEGLALLHSRTAPQFGLSIDNYIGSLPQKNEWTTDWYQFFEHHRLRPQLVRLEVDVDFLREADQFCKRLPQLIPPPTPALLHGDLWAGNQLPDDSGRPCLIDPAVYFGHPETEMAFTTLFGGFEKEFYDAYSATGCLGKDFWSRAEIHNLYPILVHANLFGGSYLLEARRIIRRWIR